MISVIVCTYGRAAALLDLLRCLASQTYRDFEVLIIDGNGANSPAAAAIRNSQASTALSVRLITSSRGLTRQRNVGLRQALGEVIIFLDDDVSVDESFLSDVIALLARPDMQDIGGVTGYDVLNYPSPLSGKWRMRYWLGAIPSLKPGDADHLGRAVPVSFLQPLSGSIEVGWLSGFCMIYRRAAMAGLFFDEHLPTYGGEDRDFSMRVAQHWRLVLCGDLRVRHHCTAQGRASDVGRMFQTAFGVGRRFRKYHHGWTDFLVIARSIVGDFLVDVLAFLARPSLNSFLTIFVRIGGLFQGLSSRIGQLTVGAAHERAGIGS